MTTDICTDVPASIAGYYYQILLAVRELTKLSDDNDGVGIEKGADIRIFLKLSGNSSIEAKFYSKNMKKYSKPIIHTIYNFYNNLVDDESLTFETNVDIDDILIHQISSIITEKDISDEHLKYVCIAIMKESLGIEITEKGNDGKLQKIKTGDKFKGYLRSQYEYIEFKQNITDKHYEYYYGKYLDEDIIPFWGMKIYKKKVKVLIQKIVFKSGKLDEKYKSIKELRDEIIINLKKYSIEERHLDCVINYLIDKFLHTTLEDEGTNIITLVELKEILKMLKINDYNVSLKFYNEKFIEKIENLDEDIIEEIDNTYEGIHNNALYNRYVLVREQILREFMNSKTNNIEDALSKYTLLYNDISTFDDLVKFVTVLTIFNNISNDKVKFIDEKFSNLIIDDDKYIYKSHGRSHSKAILKSFIKNTMHNISEYNENSIVIFSGGISGEKYPCKVNVENSTILDISYIDENRQLMKYYRNLKYKCSSCIYFYENDDEATSKIEKFERCKGWKSWELN